MCITVPYFIKNGRTFAEILQFIGFHNGSGRPSWIVEIHFLTATVLRHPCCITVPNFVKIGQTVEEISRFCDFQYGGRRHLGFSKIGNFNGRFAVRGQYASPCKCHQNRANGCRDMAIWRGFFLKMAAVRHLRLVGRVLGPSSMTT